MRTATTLAEPADVHSSDLRVAIRAFLASRESHGVVPTAGGNCHAHDLVSTWRQLTGDPMRIEVLRQELCERMGIDQRRADEELATALLRGHVRLALLPKRARR